MIEDKDIRVTVAHMRDVNFCARGARVWAARHGLDYADFVMHGIEISKIDATGDAMGILIAQRARAAARGEE